MNMNDSDIEILLKRARLDLSEDEIEWMKTAFAGYQAQLEALMALDLEEEEVGTSFMTVGKPS